MGDSASMWSRWELPPHPLGLSSGLSIWRRLPSFGTEKTQRFVRRNESMTKKFGSGQENAERVLLTHCCQAAYRRPVVFITASLLLLSSSLVATRVWSPMSPMG